MLAVVSPAKSLDFSAPPSKLPATDPVFPNDTALLAERTRKLSPADLRRLMSISDKLADLNHARFQTFGTPKLGETAKQAALAFAGDTYVGLDAGSLTRADLVWAQDHLRLLSGLYGLLRPLDIIEPYRLEMGTKLDNARGKDLYAFWSGRISSALDEALSGHREKVVINLASTEYFKAAEERRLKSRVLTCVFKESKKGGEKVIGFMAKRARGMMARHIVVNRIEATEDLKDFSEGGYTFQPEQSDDRTFVFTRPQP